MGFKVLGPLQAASAAFPVFLNQEPTVHPDDGLALGSGGEDEALGGCLMTEAEFQPQKQRCLPRCVAASSPCGTS